MNENIVNIRNKRKLENKQNNEFIKKIRTENVEIIHDSFLLIPENNNSVKKYDEKLLNEIINECREIGEFMNCIFRKDKVDFEKYFGNSYKDVADSLYEKILFLRTKRKYFKLNELNSIQRKLLMAFYYIKTTLMYSELDLIPKEISDIILQSKLNQHINFYPYYEYYKMFIISYFRNDIYESFFNYESLIKFYIVIYSNFIMKDTKNFIYHSYYSLTSLLNNFIGYYMENGIDKRDEKLFNVFLWIQKEFPVNDTPMEPRQLDFFSENCYL